MLAAIVYEPGGPDALKLETLPVPQPRSGWVLIKVKAFGLNRSELFTRQGHSPKSAVQFPRVLGIEAVGIVAADPDGFFDKGETVATAMGGLGRAFDGGYAEYTLVPAANIQRVSTKLPWDVLGAMPEMFQAAWGSLYKSLQLKSGDRLLIRGGTTSVGLAALSLAKNAGATVASTTRREDRRQMLLDAGADQVFIDGGAIAEDVRAQQPGGYDKVLELIGTTTLLDSLHCTAPQGIVCMTGMVGDQWELENFSPMGAIPTAVKLTTYAGGPEDFMATPLQEIVEDVEAGRQSVPRARTFALNEIVEAHHYMETNQAGGKIVVVTE
jgi:NADPH:quinone reductase-like Zn-dependent oxidoreductase